MLRLPAGWRLICRRGLPGEFLPIHPRSPSAGGISWRRPAKTVLHSRSWHGFFAATALAHELVLATRNTKDFVPLGVTVFNPWTDEGEP